MITSFGPYTLGESIRGLQGLREISSLEYQVLPKMFPGEKILTAPPVDFLGCEWNVTIGTVKDRIYKIAAQILPAEAERANQILSQVYGFCELEMGKPTGETGAEQPIQEDIESVLQSVRHEKSIIWDAPLGQVLLSRGKAMLHPLLHEVSGEQHFINLILTSADRPLLKNSETTKSARQTASRVGSLTMSELIAQTQHPYFRFMERYCKPVLNVMQRRLFKRMTQYVNAIQIGIYAKYLPAFQEKYGDEIGGRLAAAIANRLLAKAGKHSSSEQELAEKLTEEVLRTDEEVRYASLMSLRTLFVIEAENAEKLMRIAETLQWMAQFWDLPKIAPDPAILENLAETFYAKYTPEGKPKDITTL